MRPEIKANGMDLPVSPLLKKQRQRRRWWLTGAGGAAVALATLGLARLQPAAPWVDKSSLFIDTVKRGEMIRQVRGSGALVPEDIRWIPSQNAGRVERILVLPGARVNTNTVLVELSNPEVDQAAFDLEWQLKGAEADLENLRVELKTEDLTQRKALATAEADYSDAKSDFDIESELAKTGISAAVTLKQARTKAQELAKLLDIEQQQLAAVRDAAKARLDGQNAKVAQLQAQLALKRQQKAALQIRAGMEGVLQRLGDVSSPLQLGQQLAPGAPVACVANMAKLKAAIKLAETQVRDVQLDQPAEIDTRNGLIAGRVTRIDPAVENGTVTVDIALDGSLPRGCRPDLSVDGTIQIERLENVLYVGRPVQAEAEGQAILFKIVDSGAEAARVPVKLGRASVGTIEIIGGLEAGDQIILSDMSQWDSHDHLRIQ